jgi:hypothetical protein
MDSESSTPLLRGRNRTCFFTETSHSIILQQWQRGSPPPSVTTVPIESRSLHYRGFAIKPYAETSYNSQGTDIHAPGRIRTRNPNKRAAESAHLKDSGHWDRRYVTWLHKFDHSSTSVPNYVYELHTVLTIGVKMAVPFPARSAICYQLLLARSTRRCKNE